MVDTERMKKVLSRLPPMPPLPPDPGPGEQNPPRTLSVEALLRQEGKLEALFREIGHRSRSLSGLMERLRAASRRRSAILRRIEGSPDRFPPPPPEPGIEGEGVYRLLRQSSSVVGELAKSYSRAAGKGRLPASLAASAEESRRLLERQLRRLER